MRCLRIWRVYEQCVRSTCQRTSAAMSIRFDQLDCLGSPAHWQWRHS